MAIVLVELIAAPLFAQGWQSAGTLPTAGTPRRFAAGVNADGTLYAIGGTPWQSGGDQDGSVHRLVGASWEAAAPLSGMGPVVGQASGVDSLGRILVYGGFILGDDGPGSEQVYDPVEGPTGGVASRPAPPSAAGYFAWARDGEGRLYGLGGGPGAGGPNSGYCDRYEATTDSWQVLASMPTPASDACAVYDGVGRILVFGGINAAGDSRLANVAGYDIASNTWSDTTVLDMPVALSGARAVLGIDGRIYVAGGEAGAIGAGTTQAGVYKLDLTENLWTSVAAMGTPRRHFALVLGSDDYVYAIGGDNDTGGTDAVEKLFTPRCPAFAAQPTDLSAWSGTLACISVTTTGATPISHQWRRNGVNLSDGPTGTGSTINGATTESLVISSPGAADQGTYDCVATNACGTTTSTGAALTIRETPALPTQWTVINIHPAWADSSSYAYGISNGRIGGEAYASTLLPDGRTLTLAHPALWPMPSLIPVDLTPSGSVGGGIRSVSGDYLVGWFWHTYSCYSGGQWWTCAWQSAAYWTGDPPSFMEAPHGSGPEYDIANATDGQQVVGTLTYEYTEGSYTSCAYWWRPPDSGISLHPDSVASNSFANAVDGDHQYGGIHTSYPGPVAHAARWSGSAASFVDLHPAGFSRSWANGAGDGQAVGTAYVVDNGHAIMWVGGPDAMIDLHPPGATASSASSAGGGMQIGSVDSQAALWAGTAASYLDLGSFVPEEFASSAAEGLDVGADGTVRVVGYGYVPARGRYEAILWTPAASSTPGDTDCDGAIDGLDIEPFVLALTDPSGYAEAFPSCPIENADCNGDTQINELDVDPFVGLLMDR